MIVGGLSIRRILCILLWPLAFSLQGGLDNTGMYCAAHGWPFKTWTIVSKSISCGGRVLTGRAALGTVITYQQKQALAEGILDDSIVKGSTHAFYRYPARFSPSFAKSAIETFTRPGDIVLDPFVGSGTTLVEAALSGRPSVGADISSLATFISKVKTRPVSLKDASALVSWLDQVALNARVLPGRFPASLSTESAEQLSTIDGSAWPVRNLIAAILVELGELHTKPQRDFARAILLSSAQWALDNRRHLPSSASLRKQILERGHSMIEAALRYSEDLAVQAGNAQRARQIIPKVVNCSAEHLGSRPAIRKTDAPRLILTSPPYPGVHVLYHRWQVKGRRETSAPFWIAGLPDGKTSAFYNLAPREATKDYFARVEDCYASIAALSSGDTVLVQLVGFSNPASQLPRFLGVLERVGFSEFRLSSISNSDDGRLWRSVPNRKWFNRTRAASQSTEVVLFHRLH
jgi:hypothetical protein